MRFNSEKGQAIPLIVLMMTLLIVFTGLAIDVGMGMLQKRRLQAAVDMALLSGAQTMPDTGKATGAANTYVQTNYKKLGSETVSVNATTGCMVSGCSSPDKLSATAQTKAPTFFIKLFGIDHWDIHAKGSACGPCDTSDISFDVVVVVDRSYSMCLDGSNRPNGCYDLNQAKEGVQALLSFFNPKLDRISLATLGSGDSNSCAGTALCPTGQNYSHTTAGPSYTFKNTSASPYPCDSADPEDAYTADKGRFWRTAGDFMDGTPTNHDSWVVVPLSDGTNFKDGSGKINESSKFVSTLKCMQHKYWTPIAPAIDQARQELVANGRPKAVKIIIFLGDGGATAQPMRRDKDGEATNVQSWYTPTSGNNNRPCHDAISQAARAKAVGIQVYTIGYAVGDGSAADCTNNTGQIESGIDAQTTLEQMATDKAHYHDQPTPGDLQGVFQAVGHQIIVGGARLVE